MTIQNVAPRCRAQAIIETTRKQWAAQSAEQATMAQIPARLKRGGGKKTRDDDNEYALQAGGAWRGHEIDLTADHENGV